MGDRHRPFNGLAQVIRQTTEESNGEIILRVTSNGLTDGRIVILVDGVTSHPAVARSHKALEIERGQR